MKKTYLTCLATSAIFSLSAHATLISAESYNTTAAGAGGTYSNGTTSFNNSPNDNVLVNNFGFNATNVWTNGTSLVRPRDFNALTHSGLTDNGTGSTSASGMVVFNPASSGTDRNSYRELASAATTSSSYFLSALIFLNADSNLEANDAGLGGFVNTSSIPSNTTANFNTGFQIGGYADGDGDDFLAVYAGGQRFTLGALAVQTTYQVVAQLDVDASGNETLNAWYVVDGGSTLIHTVVGQSIETWSSVADLDVHALQTIGGSNGNQLQFDEMRFGTTLADVTTVPEPSSFALIGGLLALGSVMLRRRK